MSAEKEPRKSTITISVKRLLNTAQYENVEVKVETTEAVEWSTLAERSQKIEKIANVLTQEYQRTQSVILGELGVEEKRAWMRQAPLKKSSSNDIGDVLQ